MSILTDLKAALGNSVTVTVNGTTILTHVRTLLTDDTIAALIAVAEAAQESFVSTDPDAIPALFRALAPLVKEAPDDHA